MTELKTRLRLYLVTDAFLCKTPDLVTTVRLAVANGVTMVQLREKTATNAERVQMALAIKEALAGTGVPLVVNDDVAAAVAADVDGGTYRPGRHVNCESACAAWAGQNPRAVLRDFAGGAGG